MASTGQRTSAKSVTPHAPATATGPQAQNRNQVRVEDGAGDQVRNEVRVDDEPGVQLQNQVRVDEPANAGDGICDGDCTGDQVQNRTQVESDDQPGVQLQNRNPVRLQDGSDSGPGRGNG